MGASAKFILEDFREQDLSSLPLETQILLKAKNIENSVRRNMKPDDLAGIIKENRGVKIFDRSGKLMNHHVEWEHASNALTNNIVAIKDRLSVLATQGMTDSSIEVQILTNRLSEISTAKDLYSDLVRRAACQVEKIKFGN